MVAKFVEEYADARGMSIRYGVITEDAVGFDREYTEFNERLKGSELLEHLRLHLPTPTSMSTTRPQRLRQATPAVGPTRAFTAGSDGDAVALLA